jgi:hypothetical protein
MGPRLDYVGMDRWGVDWSGTARKVLRDVMHRHCTYHVRNFVHEEDIRNLVVFFHITGTIRYVL